MSIMWTIGSRVTKSLSLGLLGGLLMEGSASTAGDRAVVALVRKQHSVPSLSLPSSSSSSSSSTRPAPSSPSSPALPSSSITSDSASEGLKLEVAPHLVLLRVHEAVSDTDRDHVPYHPRHSLCDFRYYPMALAMCVDLETRRPRSAPLYAGAASVFGDNDAIMKALMPTMEAMLAVF
eukprot:669723-Rhodomonas_salina.2